MGDFATVNGIYGKYFPENPPARATFAVKTLPLNAKARSGHVDEGRSQDQGWGWGGACAAPSRGCRPCGHGANLATARLPARQVEIEAIAVLD